MARQMLLQVFTLVLLLLPLLHCKNLLCFFMPVLEIQKEKNIEYTVTECLPKEVCFIGLGRYGNHTALSSRGCVPKERCSGQVNVRLKGTVHKMTYSCCDWQFCNSCSALRPSCIALTLLVIAVMVCGL
ncbi:protein Bouncer-like [Nematolebias whitei]|uniref:protein Bouncer-like n=1 Tax=Nematolebias whitei TaxID=451745 RepID=UPI001898273A|nr:protein Bouncer-like [Nematolebias whitei]